MSPRLLKPVALTLAIATFLLLAAITGSTFVHELQHAAHHNARMHATGVCAWMCATAAGITTPAFVPVASAALQESITFHESDALSPVLIHRVGARAPPLS